MENSGVDLMVTYKGQASNFRYEADLIFTKYKNEITKVSDRTDFFDVNFQTGLVAVIVRNAKGQPVLLFMVTRYGTFSRCDAEYPDLRHRMALLPDDSNMLISTMIRKINADDRTYIGNPNPDFTYGFNARLVFGNFDLEALFYGVAGGKVLNFTRWFPDFYPSFAGIGNQRGFWMHGRRPIRIQVFRSLKMSRTSVPMVY